MFGGLSRFFGWINPSFEDECRAWEEWQSSQPPKHYEHSELYEYYISQRPRFEPISHKDCQNKYVWYVFGDFSSFVTPFYSIDKDKIPEYFSKLLDLYDVCKGYGRRIFTGDPVFISILRRSLERNNFRSLCDYDYEHNCYDYTSLHAHTVAQFSLSSMITRIISHYLCLFNSKKIYPDIDPHLCRGAYLKYIFGDPFHLGGGKKSITCGKTKSVSSPSITISTRNVDNNDNDNYNNLGNQEEIIRSTMMISTSAPPSISSFSSMDLIEEVGMICHHCRRITERLWGRFHTCLDCHCKKVCSLCGSLSSGELGPDGLPRCYTHK